MLTSIQLSSKLKDKLFKLLTEMQQEAGRKLRYEDVIDYLISLRLSKIGKRKAFSAQYMRSISVTEANKILREGRQYER